MEVAAGTEAPEQLITTVFEHTEGNPLFMTETVRLLVQEGDLSSGQAGKERNYHMGTQDPRKCP